MPGPANSFVIPCLTALAMTPVAASAARVPAKVITYPAPQGQPLSSEYTVTVDGKPVDVYIAPTWKPSYGPPFGGPYSFASFDLAGQAEVRITTDKPLDKLVIRPQSRAVKFVVEGKAVTFQVDRPCQLSIEPNAKFGPLLLFVNPLELNPPREGGPGVKYFGPGIHDVGAIKLSSNETLYLAGGAVIRGGVMVSGDNVRILGRGIIDGLKYPRKKGPCSSPLGMYGARHVWVEGIIVKDAWGWTVTPTRCEDVVLDNVKVVSARCENNDGIDIVNCSNVVIRNCFIRSDDDCIAPKGKYLPQVPTQNITVTRCVLWTDRAHVWRIGCESQAEVMRNLVFRDIDVIHNTSGDPLINLQPAEDMALENVVFEDIRVHDTDGPARIEALPFPTGWANKQTPGMVRNVLLKDITITGTPRPVKVVLRGADADHPVENFTFDNVSLFGKVLTADSPGVTIGEHTRNVTFKGEKTPGARP